MDQTRHFRSVGVQYTVREAGYTATDEALRKIQKYSQCKWLSITNGDNIYGSDVIGNVLAVPPLRETKQLPDVMLSPLDSRNYADQGKSCHGVLVC